MTNQAGEASEVSVIFAFPKITQGQLRVVLNVLSFVTDKLHLTNMYVHYGPSISDEE